MLSRRCNKQIADILRDSREGGTAPIPLPETKSAASSSFSPSFASSLIGVCDGIIIFGTGMAIFAIHLGWPHDRFMLYFFGVGIVATLTIIAFLFAGLYDFDAIKRPVQQWNKILAITAVVYLSLLGFVFALKMSNQFSRIWVFSSWTANVFLIALVRLFAYYVIRRCAEIGRFTRNIVVLGASEQGHRFIEELRRVDEPWNVVIGIFDDRRTRLHKGFSQQSVLGGSKALREFVRQYRVDELILALPWSADSRMLELLQGFRELPVHVRLAPDLAGFRFSASRFSPLDGIGLLDIAPKPFSGWHYLFKLVEDRVISVLLLIVLSPLMLLIAGLIKLDSPGPAFFRQKRYGFNRKLIDVYKFRTMYHEQTDQDAKVLARPGDARITRIGSWLRGTSLDELPQLLNVVKGQMSLIGPRPHALEAKAGDELYEDAIVEYAIRHKVKPGISGWAQVNGWRGETDHVDKLRGRVEHDIYYIENWSVLLELRVMFRTISAMLKGTNAH